MNPRSRAIGALGVPIILSEISVEISDRNFNRNFWQYDGDPQGSNCSRTRIHEFSSNIRRDTTLWILAKNHFFKSEIWGLSTICLKTWLKFKELYLCEYFMKIHESAFSSNWGLGGPHHIVRNFCRNFWQKFRSDFQNWHFFLKKKFFSFENLTEISVSNFDRNFWQYDGDPQGPNCSRTRIHEFSWNIRKDTALWTLAKNDFFHAFIIKFHQKFMLWDQNRALEGWGGLVRLFGLPWGFTPNRWGSR